MFQRNTWTKQYLGQMHDVMTAAADDDDDDNKGKAARKRVNETK